MNAVVKQQEIPSAQSRLEATYAHIADLAAMQREPRARLAAAQSIVDRASEAEAAERAAAQAWSDLEQRRLMGEPMDVKALQAAELKLAEAALVAEGARRKAIPAQAAVAQLSQQIGALQSQIDGEGRRVPFLKHAVLIEQGRATLDENFLEAVQVFAVAWTKAMAPFFAADTLAIANPQLGIAPTLTGMAARLQVPMPFNVPGVIGGYVELDRRELHVQAEQLLAALDSNR